jgi:2-aminoethylphosphonate-pyruvate transaminase
LIQEFGHEMARPVGEIGLADWMLKRGPDAVLLTPGPLNTDPRTREAMFRDWGSRDLQFLELTATIRRSLVDIINGHDLFTAVPLQGSGTFVVEATLATLIPRVGGKALVLVNGAYGRRMAQMLDYLGRTYCIYETSEVTPPVPEEVDRLLAEDPAISHVCLVHCETTAGILNPLAEIATVTARRGRRLLVDAMSSFAAIPICAGKIQFDAVMASSNKCLEGPPGLGFALIRKSALVGAKGNSHSLSLDLFDQWQSFERTGQWRFTPPTHIVAGLHRAIELYQAEGGQAARLRRYRNNCRLLIEGMRDLGFESFLPEELQAPVIVTFRPLDDDRFDFEIFYRYLADRGFVIYPGKLTIADSFRIGCIGDLRAEDMRCALEAIRQALSELTYSCKKK